jgi:hypothetical protein
MGRMAGARKGFRRASIAGCVVALSLLTGPGASCRAPADSAAVDSLVAWRWSALYRNRLDVVRSSPEFPWNDEAATSHLNDRLALLGELSLGERVTLFAKGATGFRLQWSYQEQQFVLEQAHAGFGLARERVTGRVFMRELMFRTGTRLTEFLSNYAPLFGGGGEGISVEARVVPGFVLSYIGCSLRDSTMTSATDGLPLFRGGAGAFHLLRLEASRTGSWHGAVMTSQSRSILFGDVVTVGADAGVRLGGVDLMAELASARRGSWDALSKKSFFDLNPERMSVDHPSDLFSDEDAFSMEADGLRLRLGPAGSFGVVPGYRFSGDRFADPQGEVAAGVNEAYAIAWWRPARYDALLSVEAADGSRGNEDAGRLREIGSLTFRGGLELEEGVICRKRGKPSAIVSLHNDTELSRLRTTARIDELGESNTLSYLAEGALNLGSSVTARGVLYLYRSRMNYYSFGLEFRPRERFLFEVTIGSFTPAYEYVLIDEALELRPPVKERSVLLYSRIWFGRV